MTVPRVPPLEDRDDAAAQAKSRRKRSLGVTLIALGAGAAVFAASQDGRCRQDNPNRPQDCRSSGGGGHGSGWIGGGRGSESSVARGGFGGAGRGFGGGS
jgi:hypothetical protein